ncbi:MAG: YlbF family regulator [Bacillota bacterium]|nr:YlbF family regulator [Bacillota bacterium]
MNTYDYAHALAKAIKSSPEYKAYKESHEQLEKDSSAKEMISDFRKNQWELQQQKMSGIEVPPEKEERFSKALEIMSLNMIVKKYLEAEYRFSIMLTDIQKIISSPLEEIISQEMVDQLQKNKEQQKE